MNKQTFSTKWLNAVVILLFCCNIHSSYCNDKRIISDSLNVSCDSIKMPDTILTKTSSDPLEMNFDSLCIHLKAHQNVSDSAAYLNMLNDSIVNIISRFNKVECELRNHIPIKDSIKINTKKVLPRKYNEILRFLISDKDNYKSNDIVYGLFAPSISYKLYQSKRIYICIDFDFGLKKWRITGSNEETLFMGDIKENNLHILRFSSIVFPEAETLKILHDNLKSL